MTPAGAPQWYAKPYKADDADEPLPEDVNRAAWLQRQIRGMADIEWERVVMEHAVADLDGARIGAWTFKLLPPGTVVGGRPALFGLSGIMTLPLLGGSTSAGGIEGGAYVAGTSCESAFDDDDVYGITSG